MATGTMTIDPQQVLENSPGANIVDLARRNSDCDPLDDFAWLDTVDNDNCFMPLDPQNKTPTKSLDFGCDGVTGSVTAWHELLQTTAPDDYCGVVFARGDFPDNPDAILARAQRRNQRGGFGLEVKIDDDSLYVLERTPAQGLINARWPYGRFNFVPAARTPGQASTAFAYQSSCSFVKDGTLHQILRITPSRTLESLPVSENSSTIGGTDVASSWPLTIQVGGMLRMGCSNTCLASKTAGSSTPDVIVVERAGIEIEPAGLSKPFYDEYTVTDPDDAPGKVLTLKSKTHERCLEIRVWVNQEPICLRAKSLPEWRLKRLDEVSDDPDYPHEAQPLYASHDLSLSDKKPINIMATFRILPTNQVAPVGAAPQLLPPGEVQNYLGVADFRKLAEHQVKPCFSPYRLWSMALAEGPRPDESTSIHLDTIGRCVEQVMGVLAVPTARTTASPPGATSSPTDRGQPLALVQNIMASQKVDLACALWHIRLLIKAHDVITATENPPDLPDNTPLQLQFSYMRCEYLALLERHITGALMWVLDVFPSLVEEGTHLLDGKLPVTKASLLLQRPRRCRATVNSDSNGATDIIRVQTNHGPRFCTTGLYCSVIVWYVVQNAGFVLKSEDIRTGLRNFLVASKKVANDDNQGNTVAVEDTLSCILRWFHSHSVMRIDQALASEDASVPTSSIAVDIDYKYHKKWADHWRAKAGKAVRLFGQGRFARRTIGHEVANLAALSLEIDAKDPSSGSGQIGCLEYIREHVGARQQTAKVESGAPSVQRWDASHTVLSAMPRPAPWELSCLGHYLPATLDIDDSQCFDACKEFLLADYTFIPSWDFSKASVVGLWWDLTTSSIICARLLTEKQRERQRERDDSEKKATSSASQTTDQQAVIITNQKRIIRILEQVSGNRGSEEAEGFTWRKRRPQLLYHADTSVQSLEDTPQVYKLKQTHNIRVRPNFRKMLMENKLTPPNWTLAEIPRTLPADKLRHISVFDFRLGGTTNDPEILVSTVSGEASYNIKSKPEPDVTTRLLKLLRSKPRLWDLYFLGKIDDMRCKLDPQDKELVKNPRLRDMILDSYQDRLFRVLNDSLVDLETKYRITFSKRMPPTAIQAAVHMWHPDALDTFDDHLGTLSHFSDNSMAGQSEPWFTDITISHWRPRTDQEGRLSKIELNCEEQEALARQPEYDQWINAHPSTDDPDPLTLPSAMTIKNFPPPTVNDERKAGGVQKTQTEHFATIREECISLVITGDGLGRYWTCTLICDLMDDGMMVGFVRDIRCILQMFIHQQYSGRALVFAYLLGQICKSLAVECERYMEEVDKIMGLEPMQLLQGLKWDTSDVVLQKLKGMLWSLEALRIFDLKLDKAIERIKEAKKSMEMALNWGKDLRPPEMRKERDRIWEEFNKRLGRLINAHNSINQRISQGSRLREGIGSVVGIEQNENISMLTWMTIIYLPLSFITAIFSMEHNIVPESLGGTEYGGLLVGCFLLTWVFSLWLQFIIQNLRHVSSKAQFHWNELERKFETGYGEVSNMVRKKVGAANAMEEVAGETGHEELPASSWGLRRRSGKRGNDGEPEHELDLIV